MKKLVLISLVFASFASQALVIRADADVISCNTTSIDGQYEFQILVGSDVALKWSYTDEQTATAARLWCRGVADEANDSRYNATGFVLIDTGYFSEDANAFKAEYPKANCSEEQAAKAPGQP